MGTPLQITGRESPLELDGKRLSKVTNSLYQPRSLYNAALGNAATVDMPGPAAGRVRLYDDISVVSDALGSAMTSATFDLITEAGTAYRFGRVTTITATQSGHYIAVGYGEVVRVVNGGANTGRIVATYVDVPVDTITLVRTTVTDTPVVVIPAPAAGYFRRWSLADRVTNSVLFLHTTRTKGYNRDSVTHSLECYLDSVLVSRSAARATLTTLDVSSPCQIAVTADTGDMTLRTVAAITTTAPVFIGSYETLPIPT